MEENFKNLENPDEIKLLKFPECVRQRIGMYLGGADSTDNLLREIIDNSMDECQHTAETIVVDRDFNGFILVADDGRGIPIYPSTEKTSDGNMITQAELSISALHSGSKFTDNKSATIGQNGVGSAAVNAVSEDYILMSRITPLNWDKSTKEVYDLWNNAGPRSKKDLFYIVWYKKGYKYVEGAAKKSDIEKNIFGKSIKKELPSGMSTIILFKPDPTIFPKSALVPEIPLQNLQYFLLIQEKFFKKKVNIYADNVLMTSSGFNGYGFEIKTRLIPEDTSLNEYVDLFISFGVDPELSSKEYCGSVNSLTVDTGVHINYVEDCFVKALKDEFNIKHRYITNGLKLCVVALASEVTFNSQSKERLKAFTKVKAADFLPLVKEFQKVFRKNAEYWTEHVNRLNFLADSMKSLSASEKAQKMIDSATGRDMYKNKLNLSEGFSDATCGSNERMKAELFLCFSGNTEILTDKNERISFIDLVDRVNSGEQLGTYSRNSAGIIEHANIIAAKEIKTSSEMVKITLDNNEVIECTPDHKMMVSSGYYIEAGTLMVGTEMMSYPISETRIITEIQLVTYDEPIPVYCLEVDTIEHNFVLAAGVFTKNCEGLSPAGSLKSGRKDTRYHAVMPLRGKVLNVAEKTADQMLDNKELSTIFNVIGLGLDCNNVTTGCKTKEEAWEKIQSMTRFGRIVISVDADPDGDSIKSSLLYAISKFARFLIDFGMVYIAESPEFIQDKKLFYPSDEKVPGSILPKGVNPNKKYKHIKGLGSLNKEDIYNAFYNPDTRRLVQVTPEGLEYSMNLVEDINNRKQLLRDKGILTNPFNFTDL